MNVQRGDRVMYQSNEFIVRAILNDGRCHLSPVRQLHHDARGSFKNSNVVADVRQLRLVEAAPSSARSQGQGVVFKASPINLAAKLPDNKESI